MGLTDTSKFLSLVLRHKPDTIGISLDEHGWANVSELIESISKTRPFDMEMLEKIVQTDNKQRYSFNEDKTLIRANQGHSIPVDVELEKKTPPEFLYHGTGEKSVASIDKEGLLSKSRLYVHLSKDTETAVKVGSRHGKPVVYRVTAGKMAEETDADSLIILTSVEKVKINMDRPEEEELGEISVAQAKEYMEEGHFGKYNMYPKFRAAVEFLEKREGRSALITSFDKLDEALKGKTGTLIR